MCNYELIRSVDAGSDERRVGIRERAKWNRCTRDCVTPTRTVLPRSPPLPTSSSSILRPLCIFICPILFLSVLFDDLICSPCTSIVLPYRGSIVYRVLSRRISERLVNVKSTCKRLLFDNWYYIYSVCGFKVILPRSDTKFLWNLWLPKIKYQIKIK